MPVPVHPLIQPMKVEPVAGAAVSETRLPVGKLALQVPPQLIPAWFVLVTVPDPDPTLLTESVDMGIGITAVKVAVTA